MKEIPLTATGRTSEKKGAARRVRAEGRIPAIVYGPGQDPVTVSVEEREFVRAHREATSSTLFKLSLDGADERKVLIREMQRDPVTSKIVHVDFHAISMTKPLSLSIPIRCEGTARGVIDDGGIQQQTMRELYISCLPTEIPDEAVVDVSELGIGDAIHVEDLDMPGVTILDELQRTIVTISMPTIVKAAAEEEEEELEGEEGEGAEGEGEEGEGEGEEKAEGEEKKKEE